MSFFAIKNPTTSSFFLFFAGHRRSSFPHIHVPLRSLHTHSVKNFSSLVDPKDEVKKEKKKKKRLSRKSKSHVFPSKIAPVSASIPEVDKEEYSVRGR